MSLIGLAASCETLLLSEMSVDLEEPIILSAGKGLVHNDTLHANQNQPNNRQNDTHNANDTLPSTTSTPKTDQQRPKLYKFYVSRFVDIVRLRFAVLNACNQCQAITISVQANAIPTANDFVHSMTVVANQTNDIEANFYPKQNAWHYIEIGFPLDEAITSTTKSSVAVNATDATANQLNGIDNRNIYVNFSIGFEFVNETIVDTNKSIANKSADSVNGTQQTAMPIDNKMTPNNTSDGKGFAALDQQNATQTLPTTATTTTTDEPPNTSQTAHTIKPNELDELNDELEFASLFAPKPAGKSRNIMYHSLARQTYREFFMFDYDLLPDDNGSIPTFINLTAGTTTGFRFNIGNVFDIGGTMSFAVVMKDNLQDAALAALESTTMRAKVNRISSDMAVAEKLVQANTADEPIPQNNKVQSLSFGMNRMNENIDDIDNNTSRSNQTIIVCMRLGEPGKNLFLPVGYFFALFGIPPKKMGNILKILYVFG